MIKKVATSAGYTVDIKVGGVSLGDSTMVKNSLTDAVFKNVKIFSQKSFEEFENDFPLVELTDTEFKHEPFWTEWSEYGWG